MTTHYPHSVSVVGIVAREDGVAREVFEETGYEVRTLHKSQVRPQAARATAPSWGSRAGRAGGRRAVRPTASTGHSGTRRRVPHIDELAARLYCTGVEGCEPLACERGGLSPGLRHRQLRGASGADEAGVAA